MCKCSSRVPQYWSPYDNRGSGLAQGLESAVTKKGEIQLTADGRKEGAEKRESLNYQCANAVSVRRHTKYQGSSIHRFQESLLYQTIKLALETSICLPVTMIKTS
jgi:hypothetical protein